MDVRARILLAVDQSGQSPSTATHAYISLPLSLSILSLSSQVLGEKLFIALSKEPRNVARNVALGHAPARGHEVCVRIDEDVANHVARVAPLVHELIQHAGVRVLTRKRRAKDLEPHARELVNDRRVVAVPPTAVQVQVGKLVGHDRHFVLVHAREERGKKLDFGKVAAQVNQHVDVARLDAVARDAVARVDRPHTIEFQR
ncbi:hypothetical protein PsorP6_011932 [Peronosclerospora sorghi]|uniref:Uncharacterized protein n=1 Tax=Peronosclerospora sorghi TaxID=230839 RepID=A0ACC0WLM7_9STRA|nr:hypothetical protein PsorP6_011932 [Peronosclerospora sorghi]